MDSAKICFAAVTAVCLCVILKQWKSDFLPLLRLGITVAFALALLGLASPLAEYVKSLSDTATLGEDAAIPVKALGVAVLTQCCADICRDAGEGSVAGGVELAGKIEILVLCLPLVNRLLELARGLLALAS